MANERFKVTERVNEKKELVTGKIEETQDKARNAAAEKATGLISDKLDMVTMVVVDGLDNSLDLPGFLAQPLEIMVRETVEDIKHETTAGIESFIVKEEEWQPTIRVEDLNCWGKFRGWVLYHWCPYDHAIGYQMVDPVYVMMKLCAALPFFGTQALFYAFLFMLHDKRDDYQMVKYILDFKGMQALTLGIMGVLIGGYRYWYCANQHPPNCQIKGPAAGRFFYTSLVGWLGCAMLVWSAFAMLGCKKCRKGGDRMVGGGKLSNWIVYDMFCFCVAVGFVGYAISTEHILDGTDLGADDLTLAINRKQTPDGSDYRFRQFAYWAKVLYGLLSMPFIIFMVPAIDVMFTHASPTGYTLAGEVAPKQVQKTEKETHEEIAETIEDTAIEEILLEMLQLAIYGGRLPIDEWSAKMAPSFTGIAESLKDSKEAIKTKADAARGEDGGILTMVGGAAKGLKDEAADKAVDQLKVTVASLTHLVSKQVVYNLNTSMELPKFLAESVEKLLNSIVPDVQMELNDGIDEYFNKQLNGDDEPEEEVVLGCCGKIKAYMLYHYLPFDHGLGWLFSDPLWLILKGLSMLPLLGTEFVVYFLYFFMIDKTDEYQLTRFIFDLKGLAVLSMGIMHAAFGAAGYFYCINTYFESDELTYVYESYYQNGSTTHITMISNGTLANTTCAASCITNVIEDCVPDGELNCLTCGLTDNARLQVTEAANNINCSALEPTVDTPEFVQYGLTCLMCTTQGPGDTYWQLTDVLEPGDECATSMAAEYPLFYWVIGTWVGTVLLVWAAFYKLIVFKYMAVMEEEEDGRVHKKKERKTILDARLDRDYGQLSRVKSLFAYDVGCMVTISAVVTVALVAGEPGLKDWEVRQLLYWSKCTYGLLSLPCKPPAPTHTNTRPPSVALCGLMFLTLALLNRSRRRPVLFVAVDAPALPVFPCHWLQLCREVRSDEEEAQARRRTERDGEGPSHVKCRQQPAGGFRGCSVA